MSLEIEQIQSWLGQMPRHPKQTHGINESDSEIVAIAKNLYLATTVDSIAEEISYGLYKDPYTMGWMAATASLSDLAAVGASPLGLLFSAHWSRDFTLAQKKRAASGVRAALRAAATPLLGGDTGQAAQTQLTGVGVGLCDSKPLSRVGLKPGDFLCLTGKMGLGPALGFRHLLGDRGSILKESMFRPRARISEGTTLRKLASAAMDTSDGLASTLATLSSLNKISIKLEWSDAWVHPKALAYCRAQKISPVSLLFGEHGDFQLVAGIPPKNLARARAKHKDLFAIGRVQPRAQGHRFVRGRMSHALEIDRVARAKKSSLKEIERAFKDLLSYAASLG